MSNFEIFSCPICRGELLRKEGSLLCESGHAFDIAKAGYVNLLPVQKMNSKMPGDSKEMVSSRRNFLSKGYYEPLRQEISEMLKKYLPNGGRVFDCGCGEGYYTAKMAQAFDVFGADISKIAVEKAAKLAKGASFAVASAYDLPIKSESVDLLTNIFSPLALDEFRRVIKVGGYFLYVVPAEKHLFEMKRVLYEKPYENAVTMPEYFGFCYEETRKVSFPLEVLEREDIMSLFNMTPYLWRTPKEGILRLTELETLSDNGEFYIHLLKKEN